MNRKPYYSVITKITQTALMVGESGSGAIENLLFSSWVTTFKTCYFLVNICLVLIDFLTKEVFFIQKEFAKLGAQGSL
jgi:hypothetical protein